MALLFIDSFDHYATADIGEKWTNAGGMISASYARHGLGGANTSSERAITLPAQTSMMCGFACKPIGLGSGRLIALSSGEIISDAVTSPLLSKFLILNLLPSGQLEVKGGTTGTGPGTGGTRYGVTDPPYILQDGVWAYIEVKMTDIAADSTITVRINQQTALVCTGDTRIKGLSGLPIYTEWNMFCLGSLGYNSAIDDLYVGSLSGGRYTDFLGEVRIDCHFPNAPGTYTQWTRGGVDSGNNWDQVNETAPNDNTDYNEAATSGLIDTFASEAFVPEGNTLLAIQHVMAATKYDAGNALIAPVLRQGTTDYVGTVRAPGQLTYTYFLQLHESQPSGGAWSEAAFEAMEVGYKRTE